MAKKKVLFFVEAMGGGVFTYVTNLANGLSNDFDVYVAYATRPQTPKDYKKYFNKNIHLIKVKNFKREISFSDIRAFFEMKKICKLVKPDIIHLHSSKAGLLGRFAFNGNNIPLFYTPHGYSFLMKNISPFRRKFYWLLEKVAGLRHCTTISCSYGENIETGKLTTSRLYVDNGINIKEIDKALKGKTKKRGDSFTIFTIGRVSVQKNPSLFNKIASKFPNINFVWIGDGKLRKSLTEKNIKITGWLTSEETLKRAANYDMFLLTSEWEGLPMSLLEAMYLKKVCVASNVIGNNNVIENGKNGYLCSNIREYCSAINKVIEGNNAKIISAAYSDIINHYNSDKMATEYIKIYREAIKRRKTN